MDTKHEWSEKKTVRQIIASTRDCTGSQHWTTVFANSISTPREIENLVLPQTKETLALNWFAKTRVYFFFDKIGSTLKKWRKDNGRRLAVNGEYNLKKWYLFCFQLKKASKRLPMTTNDCSDLSLWASCVLRRFFTADCLRLACVCLLFYWCLFVILCLFVCDLQRCGASSLMFNWAIWASLYDLLMPQRFEVMLFGLQSGT